MAEYAKLPKIGLTMKTGVVSALLVAVGDTVKKGDAVAEFETDKITGDVESPTDGVVLELLVSAGDEVEVLAPMMLIGNAGEAAIAMAPAVVESQAAAVPTMEEEPEAAVSAKEAWVLAMPMARRIARQNGINLANVRASSGDDIIRVKDVEKALGSSTVRVTPLAKKIAEDNDVDLKNVMGTGPSGRIGKDDVLGAMAASTTPASVQADGGMSRRKMSGMRRVIAERLVLSKQTIPHVYFKSAVDATALMALKDKLREAHAKGLAPKVTVNDILMKAVATVLAGMPQMCVQLDGDEIVTFDSVNLGMAVSVENGLVVPVIKAADKLPLSALAKEAATLTEKARGGKLMPDEYKGGIFTVSNLGTSGIDEFSAIINPPESAILAVGTVKEKAVVIGGEIVIRPMMTLTISVDHRLIDGALAAEFMKRLKEIVENVYLAVI